MIHTTLVPLDGSPLAEAALPEARRLARAAAATIVLVRVARGGIALQDQRAAQLSALAEAEAYLRIKARELSSAGFGVRTDVFCNDPAEGIGLAAMVHGASLVVMSTHGRSGLRRALLGSVAAQVVHEASIPARIAKSWCPWMARRSPRARCGSSRGRTSRGKPRWCSPRPYRPLMWPGRRNRSLRPTSRRGHTDTSGATRSIAATRPPAIYTPPP